jgi:hypothetical protein
MQSIAEKTQGRAPNGDLRHMLSDDHQRLERLFADLLAAFKAEAREDAARLWSAFDAGLRTHLQLEEQHIFPEFAKSRAVEVAALQREHEQIRSRLLELGVGVDLHFTNDKHVEQFIRELRLHAAREDALMYGSRDRADRRAHRGAGRGRIHPPDGYRRDSRRSAQAARATSTSSAFTPRCSRTS